MYIVGFSLYVKNTDLLAKAHNIIYILTIYICECEDNSVLNLRRCQSLSIFFYKIAFARVCFCMKLLSENIKMLTIKQRFGEIEIVSTKRAFMSARLK